MVVLTSKSPSPKSAQTHATTAFQAIAREKLISQTGRAHARAYQKQTAVVGDPEEAIAQAEGCQECEAELTADTLRLLTIGDEPEIVLCDQYSLLHEHHPDPDYRFPTSSERR